MMRGVDYLNCVNVVGAEREMLYIVIVTERVRMNDKAAAATDIIKKIRYFAVNIEDISVFDKPLLIKSIKQKICAVIGIFYPEENVQSNFISRFLRIFIALAVKLDALFPRQVTGNGGISVEEMVGDKNAVIALVLLFPSHFRSR